MILSDNGKILMSPDGKVYSGASGGGCKLYKHILETSFFVEQGSPKKAYFEFVNESDTPITKQQFIDYINNYPYPEFTTSTIYGVTRDNVITCKIDNNYYGEKYFSVITYHLEGATIVEHVISIGSELKDEQIAEFMDAVTTFITEV